MTDMISGLVLDDSKWPLAGIVGSAILVAVFVARYRRQGPVDRNGILAAMNLLYGCMIGVLACGHLLAVTIKVSLGTLECSWWMLYPIGMVLAVPAGWLMFLAGRQRRNADWPRKAATAINVWLAICLVLFGVHNLPLVAIAGLNLAYQAHSGRVVGRALVGLTVVAHLAIFFASLVVFVSGQSFKQLLGMD